MVSPADEPEAVLIASDIRLRCAGRTVEGAVPVVPISLNDMMGKLLSFELLFLSITGVCKLTL